VVTDFSFSFPIQEEGDLGLILVDDATGVETVLTNPAHYTVDTVNGTWENGGTIHTVSGGSPYAYPSGNTLLFYRTTSQVQESEYETGKTLSMSSLRENLDNLTMMVQELSEDVSRAALLKKSSSTTGLELPDSGQNKYIGWDALGANLENKDSIVTTTGSTNIRFLSNYASFADAVTAIGATVTTLVLDIGGTVSANTTTPTTLHIIGTRMGGLTVATGVTLTISGPVESGAYQIFSGSGTVTVSSYPQERAWWGEAQRLDLKSNLILGSDADGDIYYRASNVTTRLPKGTAGQTLKMNTGATAPEWGAANIVLGSDADGDIYYRASSVTTRLPKGTAGQILKMNSGATAPEWGAGGKLVQMQYSRSTTPGSTTAVIPFDNTTPQNTEGVELLTVSITPKSASNLLIIEVDIAAADGNGVGAVIISLFKDSTVDAIATAYSVIPSADYSDLLHLSHIMPAGSTSSTTFKIRFGPQTGTGYWLRRYSYDMFNGTLAMILKVTEVEP
jgi:hypothetical protein